MKIIIKMENGAPILFFPEEKERNGAIGCYSSREGHSIASRAYMRGLKSPATKEEIVRCWRALHHYAQHAAYCESL